MATERVPAAAARRRAVRVAVRLGLVMLASGAQAREVETSLRAVMEGLGLHGAQAVVTYSTVTASFIASEDAEAVTATQVVHRWDPNYDRLAAAAVLINAIREGRVDLRTAESELDAVVARTYPYPRWLGLAAPALLSMTLLPLLAETDAARDALQGQAIETAFTIGVGVASGSIILLAVQRYRGRLILPVAGAVTTGLAARVGRSVSGWARRQRHRTDPTKATDTESDQPT